MEGGGGCTKTNQIPETSWHFQLRKCNLTPQPTLFQARLHRDEDHFSFLLSSARVPAEAINCKVSLESRITWKKNQNREVGHGPQHEEYIHPELRHGANLAAELSQPRLNHRECSLYTPTACKDNTMNRQFCDIKYYQWHFSYPKCYVKGCILKYPPMKNIKTISKTETKATWPNEAAATGSSEM